MNSSCRWDLNTLSEQIVMSEFYYYQYAIRESGVVLEAMMEFLEDSTESQMALAARYVALAESRGAAYLSSQAFLRVL